MDSLVSSGSEGGLDWAVAGRCLPGAGVSGDAHAVLGFSGGVLVAAIDGLGHGPEAHAAARAAVAALNEDPSLPVATLVQRCHQALRRLRGVVMSVASFDTLHCNLWWLGVGNVEGVLLRAVHGAAPRRERLLVRGGVVGQNLPSLQPVLLPVSPGDTLVLATDGLDASGLDLTSAAFVLEHAVTTALQKHAKPSDDALILAVRCRSQADV